MKVEIIISPTPLVESGIKLLPCNIPPQGPTVALFPWGTIWLTNKKLNIELTLWLVEDRTWAGTGWVACPGRWALAVQLDSLGSSSGRRRRERWPPLPASCHQTWLAAPERRCAHLTRGCSWLLWEKKKKNHCVSVSASLASCVCLCVLHLFI